MPPGENDPGCYTGAELLLPEIPKGSSGGELSISFVAKSRSEIFSNGYLEPVRIWARLLVNADNQPSSAPDPPGLASINRKTA